jgi:hypothetical protein
VRARRCGNSNAGAWTYVITHGMGGTAADDRFHRLAAAIGQSVPRANVLMLDWSEPASARINGFPNPWKVAGSIDAVGDQAAAVLRQAKLDPARTTLIGESFGNWVNARIASQLDGVHGMLAFNPATAAGGYAPADLRRHSQIAWSFHSYSAYDTNREIAHGDFLLQTPADADDLQQHVWGIAWLTDRVAAGDTSWLKMNKPLPARKAAHFRALATISGDLARQQFPRERPLAATTSAAGRDLAMSASTVTAP